ncbi:hypothetical protein P4O66_020811, partial [Electrophorus voltai]
LIDHKPATESEQPWRPEFGWLLGVRSYTHAALVKLLPCPRSRGPLPSASQQKEVLKQRACLAQAACVFSRRASPPRRLAALCLRSSRLQARRFPRQHAVPAADMTDMLMNENKPVSGYDTEGKEGVRIQSCHCAEGPVTLRYLQYARRSLQDAHAHLGKGSSAVGFPQLANYLHD